MNETVVFEKNFNLLSSWTVFVRNLKFFVKLDSFEEKFQFLSSWRVFEKNLNSLTSWTVFDKILIFCQVEQFFVRNFNSLSSLTFFEFFAELNRFENKISIFVDFDGFCKKVFLSRWTVLPKKCQFFVDLNNDFSSNWTLFWKKIIYSTCGKMVSV